MRATLSADVNVASGTIAFAPTSGTTAASTGWPFAIATEDANYKGVSVAVPVAALAVVGDTLFVSLYGQSDGTQFTGYINCPVPASLPRATIGGLPSMAGSISTGTYGARTTVFTQLSDGWNSSGRSVASRSPRRAGGLTATAPTGSPSVCGGGKLAFHDISGSTATLSPGQTCPVSLPCGPPPSPRSVVRAHASHAHEHGRIARGRGGVLFVNVTGDAPQACGNHGLSFICPTAP